VAVQLQGSSHGIRGLNPGDGSPWTASCQLSASEAAEVRALQDACHQAVCDGSQHVPSLENNEVNEVMSIIEYHQTYSMDATRLVSSGLYTQELAQAIELHAEAPGHWVIDVSALV